MKYSMGLALQYLPFFAAGHVWASLSDYPADGFSFPYQAAIHWGSLLIAFWGLWLTRLNLRRYFRDEVAALVILLVGIGTNYFNYASIDAALTHNYLFTLYALLIWLSIRWHEKPNAKYGLAIGLVVGLAALTRPTDIIVGLIPLLWGWNGLRARLDLFRKRRLDLGIAALAALAVGAFQLIYWKSVSGDWIVYSYQDQGFSFLHPHLLDVFFSYKKGWLVYSPLLSLAIVGFLFLWRRKDLFWVAFLFFIVNTWIVSAWDVWWYGGSFGQRAMVQSYALLAFPMAALVEAGWKLWWSRVVLFSILLFGIALNLFQTWQAHAGGLDPENMNRAYYWKLFFNTRVTTTDQFLMDSNVRPFRHPKVVETVFFRDFESPGSDSLQISRDTAFSGNQSLKIGPLSRSVFYSIPYQPDLKKANGVHVSGQFFGYKKEWDIWKMGQLHVAFAQSGTTIYDNLVRVPRVMKSRHWVETGADFRFSTEPFDEIRVYFDNLSEVKTVYIDDLKVELLHGK
ncbi:MAG: glycosyltransferase family 39 protein [Saprospirales bacterium]|nr:glycosyltransferase family 39 protein [Saprospirales bacterium]